MIRMGIEMYLERTMTKFVLKMLPKISQIHHNKIRPIYQIRQKIWDVLKKKNLLGVRFPWLGWREKSKRKWKTRLQLKNHKFPPNRVSTLPSYRRVRCFSSSDVTHQFHEFFREHLLQLNWVRRVVFVRHYG